MIRKQLFGWLMRAAHIGYKGWLWLARPITIGVRAVVLCNGQVLLVRHTYLDGWSLPGGGVHRGETLEQAARREVREETGLLVRELLLVSLYTNFSEHKTNHIAVYAGVIQDALLAESPSLEIAEQRFFPTAALPEGIFPEHARRIGEALERLAR